MEDQGCREEITPTARLRLRRARFRRKVLRRPLVAIRHRGLQPTDAFVVSYPRSGTTWTLFMLCDLLAGVRTSFGQLHETTPYVGGHLRAPGILSNGGRLVYSHEVVGVGARPVVYLVRDPRSVVLSEYRWQLMSGLFDGGLGVFLDDFVRGRSNPWGAWGDHVQTWFDHGRRAQDQLLVVRYEDMRRRPEEQLERIATFLGESVSPSRIAGAVSDNDLAAMREKERCSSPPKFRRDIDCVGEGGVDLWREKLAPPQATLIAERFAPSMALAGYDA